MMLTHDFVVMPDTAVVGDAFQKLVSAKANMGWHVVVRYVDHYGAILAGKLAQLALAGRDAPAALAVALHDLNIPSVNTMQSPPADPDKVRQTTLVIQDDQPLALIYELIRSVDMAAKKAFDQLRDEASSQAGASIPDLLTLAKNKRDFIVALDMDTVGAALHKLDIARGKMHWYIVVKYADHYGAILAGKLAEVALGYGEQAAVNVPLRNIAIPGVNVAPHSQLRDPGDISQLTLVLENDTPLALLDVAIRNAELATAQSAFEQLTSAALPPSSKDPLVSRAYAGESATTDARARYVNTWFTDRVGGEPFKRERSLARGQRCFVQLHIGPLLKESIIVAPRPIDPDLPPVPKEGLLLRIKLFSRDFEIKEDTAEVRLFKTGATERLHLAVTAPQTAGEARLRIGIYYQNNLVQSVLFHALIDDKGTEQNGHANWAELEYSLSEDFADITQLQPRRISVFVNDSPDGTHMIGVMGQVAGTLNIEDNRVTKAVNEFRARLLDITVVAVGDKKKYRYGPDNAGDKNQFIEDIKTLAYLGVNLFESIFVTPGKADLTDNLSQALAGPQPAVIQIANLTSDLLYPWAGVYDRPLFIDRSKNQVCLEPLKHDTPEAALAACGGCTHSDESNTICLAGFWGFRHIIEQPLGKVEQGDKPSSAVLEIKASGKPRASMNVYVGDDLVLRAQHQGWVVKQVEQKGGQVDLADELSKVKQDLPQPQQLCYFYCHGGSSPDKINPWLTLGQDGALYPTDLRPMGLDKAWRLQNSHPLVFINACHSFGFTPEALSAFLPRFAWAGASGVIGTEVSIFEPLAVEFGQGLIQAFLNGELVGQAVQRLRWQLLLKYNVLGLVYTPYCYANLHLVSS